MIGKNDNVNIIGVLFSLSIAFWGGQMANHFSKSLPKAWTYDQGVINDAELWVFAITAIAGVVFLVDVVCIIWWYSQYIYKIQPTPTFQTHFIDFGICAAFNVAASLWTSGWFLGATMFGSGLLFFRFYGLRNSPFANGNDQAILLSAFRWMIAAFVVSTILSLAVFSLLSHLDWDYQIMFPVLAILLSGIGIYLTIKHREMITVSADIHEVRRKRFKPMELYWPPALKHNESLRRQVRDACRKGLEAFDSLFDVDRRNKLVRLQSRVHAQGDLVIQSYILGIPSCQLDGKDSVTTLRTSEVTHKAQLVGLSHWLDDLVDGRKEHYVLQILQIHDRDKLSESIRKAIGEHSDKAFHEIYGGLIKRHVLGNDVWDGVCKAIEERSLTGNECYLYAGLNRVAIGAVMFSPRVEEKKRDAVIKAHNRLVREKAIEAAPSEFQDAVKEVLEEIDSDDDQIGKALLALTTKTVQELGMGSEGQRVNFTLSLLYSLLYAPLLYFHDIDNELDEGEMAVLEPFDVGYERILPWLRQIREIIDKMGNLNDKRHEGRLLQLDMAFRCFEHAIPTVARNELREIYCPPPAESVPAESTLKMPRVQRNVGR